MPTPRTKWEKSFKNWIYFECPFREIKSYFKKHFVSFRKISGYLLPCRLLVQTEELRQVRAARDVDAAKLEALNAQVAELQRSEARLRDQVQQLSTASTSRVGQLHAPC